MTALDGSGLSLRAATELDTERLLAWRNDATVRAASRSTHRVTEPEHSHWLAEVLADPDRHLLVAELEAEAIGQVRFDRTRGFVYEISVSVASVRRGAGIGSELVRVGCRWLWDRTNATEVEAWVRSDNEASRSAFESAGFVPVAGDRPGFERFLLQRPEVWAHELRGAPVTG